MRSRIFAFIVMPVVLSACASTVPVATSTRTEQTRSEVPQTVRKKPTQQRSVNLLDSARQCVALAMYWEARGEGRPGMVAVGSVVMNRVRSDEFPDTPCDVVYQGGETPPCQFSWWCDGKSDRPQNQVQWSLALNTATEVLAERTDDPTGGALFFRSTAASGSPGSVCRQPRSAVTFSTGEVPWSQIRRNRPEV